MGVLVTSICEMVWRFAYVNIIGLLLCLLGGVVLGAAPAWIAIYTVLDNRDQGISACSRRMWKVYKNEFWPANRDSCVLVVASVVLVLLTRMVWGSELLTIVIAMGSAVLLVSILAMRTAINGDVRQDFHNAILLWMKASFLVFMTLLSIVTIWILFSFNALLWIYFGLSVPVYIMRQLLNDRITSIVSGGDCADSNIYLQRGSV